MLGLDRPNTALAVHLGPQALPAPVLELQSELGEAPDPRNKAGWPSPQCPPLSSPASSRNPGSDDGGRAVGKESTAWRLQNSRIN